jgi:hypothetical protein
MEREAYCRNPGKRTLRDQANGVIGSASRQAKWTWFVEQNLLTIKALKTSLDSIETYYRCILYRYFFGWILTLEAWFKVE